MAKNSARDIEITAFATHQIITQPNPLRSVLRRVEDKDMDDPIGRAEQALAGLAGEFKDWMATEINRLSAAYVAIRHDGFSKDRRDELFRAAHDIKGRCRDFRLSGGGGRSREPVPRHRTRARSRKGTGRAVHAPHQRHPCHRAREHQARQHQRLRRTQPAPAQGRRRLSRRRQPRSPRASRGDPGTEHRAGGVASPFARCCRVGKAKRCPPIDMNCAERRWARRNAPLPRPTASRYAAIRSSYTGSTVSSATSSSQNSLASSRADSVAKRRNRTISGSVAPRSVSQ
ncbi:hypothetical protein ACVWZV_005013 [Bradyrhizobium sp. GM5.1]